MARAGLVDDSGVFLSPNGAFWCQDDTKRGNFLSLCKIYRPQENLWPAIKKKINYLTSTEMVEE
jgi:hypothetical protein